VLGLWFTVSQADLAREGSGVFVAARTGLRVLGARLGAVLLFHLLFFIASVGISLCALPLSLLLNVGLRDDPMVHLAARLLLFFLQSVPQSVLALALGASLVALVRGEARGEVAG
ncbi:MAG TPA: hypothetical protein VOA87_15890, partial [Thermoanaerobaculia bacterium]|nr:hypothetical protein [Thermoanaerobaculia bacterium]